MFATTSQHDSTSEDTLGGRIAHSREAAGLSVEEAARRLGVLTESWNAWECDRDAPRASRLTMMAGLLSVSPSWLLMGMGTGPIERATYDSSELMRAFRETSQEVAALNRRMQEIADTLSRQQDAEGEGATA